MQIIGDTTVRLAGIRIVQGWHAPYEVVAIVDLATDHVDMHRRPSFAETHDTPERAEELWTGLEEITTRQIDEHGEGGDHATDHGTDTYRPTALHTQP